MSELADLFERAVDEFGNRVEAVDKDQWKNATPCTEWNVSDLVNHIVYEDRWVPPLLAGKTIQDVGDRFEGDLLGDDAKGAWAEAANEALNSVAEVDDERIVHLSFGDFPARFYISQLLSDHVIHAWDLARAIGGDDRLDPDLVDFVYDFIAPQVEQWRGAGVFGAAQDVPPDANRQTELLAMVGRKT